MKNEKLEKLEKELRFLIEVERKKELAVYEKSLADNVKVEDIAREIYQKRGIDYSKLHNGIFDNLESNITEFGSLFKNKDSSIRKKMIIDIIYIVIIVVFMKVPFDLIRDIGYDYIELLSTNNTIFILWRLAFLLLYTIVLICTLIIFIRNFNKKYR